MPRPSHSSSFTLISLSLVFLPAALSGQRTVPELQALAAQGDASAQFNLGRLHVTGTGVPQDDATAARWYRRAAEQGHAGAQHSLGVRYDSGQGVSEDDTEAVLWYTRAAQQQHWEAQFRLGRMYANGTGVNQDNVQAVQWFRLAAAQGNIHAQECLLRMTKEGRLNESERSNSSCSTKYNNICN